jgi:UDP-N-acetylmuramoyl-tripeptide--D-alanyl-D-alanine ligase
VRFRAFDVAVATGGRLVGRDVELSGASFDSRSIEPGQLFVPLVAERDGHEFIDAAVQAGAGAYLTSRAAEAGAPAATAIEVDDTAAALMRLASWARDQHHDHVVGITGSVGKTSTKDLTAGAVGATKRVTANERSFNNEQGLPVTILGAVDDTEVLVLEMGMRGFGEISRLCEVGRPTIGVVTAVGYAHTERVGGIEGVARAKRELVEALPPEGTAVLNADDPRVLAMAGHTSARVITYGTSARADVRVTDLEVDEYARPSFRVDTPWGTTRVKLAVSGLHMAVNAAAAISVAGEVGVALDAAVEALASTSMSAMRMETSRSTSGAIVVNDAYNANPTSMRAALTSLAAVSAQRRVAILGLMAELDDPEHSHREIAAFAAELGITVIATGTHLYGVDPVDDPVAALGAVGPDLAVLVKGSRIAGLEHVAHTLLAP